MDDEINKEESTSTQAEESQAVSGRKLPMISVKSASILSGVIIALALIFVYKGMFIAAVVNGSPISRFAVIHTIEKKSGKAALDMLIIQKVLADEVHKKGIIVSEPEIAAEMKIIEDRFVGQGTTLDAYLVTQGVTRDDVRNQIITQLEVEKLLGDKIAVSDAEVNQYIADHKIVVSKDKDAEMRTQVATQIKQDKTNKEGNTLVESLRSSAKVTYFVQY